MLAMLCYTPGSYEDKYKITSRIIVFRNGLFITSLFHSESYKTSHDHESTNYGQGIGTDVKDQEFQDEREDDITGTDQPYRWGSFCFQGYVLHKLDTQEEDAITD